MKSGEVWASRWTGHWLGLLAWLLAGCAAGEPHVDRALKAEKPPLADDAVVARDYRLGCPDVLQVDVPGRADLSGKKVVDPEGRIDLGAFGRLRVEGRTTTEIGGYLAGVAGLPTDQVQVGLAEFNSQKIYLVGQVVGWQRAVAYRGPETVLDLLQRTGGITTGAAADDVYVLRARVAEGGQPEVFHINLQDIAVDHDDRTNLHVQPFDQIYVGETKRSRLRNCIPFCVRPFYDAICGLRRSPAKPALPASQPGKPLEQAARPFVPEPRAPGAPAPLPGLPDAPSLTRS